MKIMKSLYLILFNKIQSAKTINALYIVYSGFMLYAGVSKFMDLLSFAFGMTNFSLFNDDLVFFLTFLIPSLEILLAFSLIINKTRKYGLYMLISLFLLYSVYLTLFKYFATSSWCSCGSVIDLGLSNHLVFNFFITLPLLFMVTQSTNKETR